MKHVWVNACTCAVTASTTAGALLPTVVTAMPGSEVDQRVAVGVDDDATGGGGHVHRQGRAHTARHRRRLPRLQALRNGPWNRGHQAALLDDGALVHYLRSQRCSFGSWFDTSTVRGGSQRSRCPYCTVFGESSCAKMSPVVAVTDVLEQKELALHPVHIPRPTVGIRWVATSELPDPAPFFEGGEVLLTTGLQTTEWRDEWQQYVDSLVDAGTVAIGMATGLTYTRSPDELVAACRQSGLNLFEVPRRTPFVAVSHTISRLLAEEEEAGAREALAVQRKLTAAAAKPNPARTVSQVLADALGGATAVLTTDGRVQLEPIGRRSGELDLSELASELRRMHLRGSRSAATVTNPQGTTLLQPIGVSRPRSRVLVALGPPRLTEAQRSAVTTAVALLSLIAEQQQHSAATYRRLRRRAVDLLVTGDGHTAELLLQTEPTPRALPTSLRLVLASGPGPQIEDIGHRTRRPLHRRRRIRHTAVCGGAQHACRGDRRVSCPGRHAGGNGKRGRRRARIRELSDRGPGTGPSQPDDPRGRMGTHSAAGATRTHRHDQCAKVRGIISGRPRPRAGRNPEVLPASSRISAESRRRAWLASQYGAQPARRDCRCTARLARRPPDTRERMDRTASDAVTEHDRGERGRARVIDCRTPASGSLRNPERLGTVNRRSDRRLRGTAGDEKQFVAGFEHFVGPGDDDVVAADHGEQGGVTR